MVLAKHSFRHSKNHKDSKFVFKVNIDRWEVGFYSGITDGQTNGWTDPLLLLQYRFLICV